MFRHGATRLVILLGPWAIKVASPRYGQRYFVYGCLANLLEWAHWRQERHPNLAPVYWCSPLGLVSVMKRYRNMVNRLLTTAELETLPFCGHIDNNGHNVAEDDGRLVLIDYGQADLFYSLPTPWGVVDG